MGKCCGVGRKGWNKRSWEGEMEKKVVGKEMEKVLEFGERDEKRLWVWGKRWEKACRDGEIEIEKKNLWKWGRALWIKGKLGKRFVGLGGKIWEERICGIGGKNGTEACGVGTRCL